MTDTKLIIKKEVNMSRAICLLSGAGGLWFLLAGATALNGIYVLFSLSIIASSFMLWLRLKKERE